MNASAEPFHRALPQLILASASPRRCELLRAAGFEFEVCPARVEEVNPDYCSPREIVLWNALRKAREVAARRPKAVVIGADTLVACDARIYGKPKDLAEAGRVLASLSGKSHVVYTGVAVLHDGGRGQHGFVEQAKVTFFRLSAQDIRSYFEDVNPLDKAGAYGAQETSRVQLVRRIDGREDTVFGLPVAPLTRLLARISRLLARKVGIPGSPGTHCPEATLAHGRVSS